MSQAATVRALIAQQARTQPQALYALATETSDRIDYASLELQCQRVATLLMAQGTQPGDTVSLVMPNGLNTLRLLLGALHGGWCVNPVNLLSSAEQMRYVLEHSDCKLVIASPEWADPVRAVLATLARPVALLVCSADFDAAHDPLPDRHHARGELRAHATRGRGVHVQPPGACRAGDRNPAGPPPCDAGPAPGVCGGVAGIAGRLEPLLTDASRIERDAAAPVGTKSPQNCGCSTRLDCYIPRQMSFCMSS
jgi:hypothetical protein